MGDKPLAEQLGEAKRLHGELSDILTDGWDRETYVHPEIPEGLCNAIAGVLKTVSANAPEILRALERIAALEWAKDTWRQQAQHSWDRIAALTEQLRAVLDMPGVPGDTHPVYRKAREVLDGK